jgi:uncharacterized membrane protein YqaE (UPF0057 family)
MKKIFCSLLMTTLMFSMIPFQSEASLMPPGGKPDAATIKAAFAEFKGLSRHERKGRVKEVKKQWKLIKKERKANKSAKVEMVVLIILAILLPPLAVYLHQGEINGKFWLSILFWFLFIIPGIIFALLVVTDTI